MTQRSGIWREHLQFARWMEVIQSCVDFPATLHIIFTQTTQIPTHWYGRWSRHRTFRRTSWPRGPWDPGWWTARGEAHCSWRRCLSFRSPPPYSPAGPARWPSVDRRDPLRWSDTGRVQEEEDHDEGRGRTRWWRCLEKDPYYYSVLEQTLCGGSVLFPNIYLTPIT